MKRIQRLLCLLLTATFVVGPAPLWPAQARSGPLPLAAGLDLDPWVDVELPSGEARVAPPGIRLPGPAPAPRLSWTHRVGAQGVLGAGWGTTLELRVVRRGPRTLSLLTPDGVRRFDKHDERYLVRLGEPAWLSETEDGYLLVEGDERLRFDAQGRLRAYGNARAEVEVEWLEGRPSQLRDEHGRSLSFSYVDGRLEAAADHGGRRWTFAYEDGRLVATGSPSGQLVEFSYAGDRLSGVRSAGAELSLSYDDAGRLTSMGGSGVVARDYVYGDAGVEVASADGWRRVDEQPLEGGSVLELEDLSGTVRIERDARQLPVRVETPRGIARLRYDAVGHRIAARGPWGERLELSWSGERLTRVAGDEGAHEFDYGSHGQLTGLRFPDGGEVQLGYDELGRVVRFTDPSGFETAYGYDERGLLSEVQGAKHVRLDYDAWCRVETVTRGDDTLQLAYDAGDRVVARVDGVGNKVRLRYDVSGNLSELINARGVSTHFAYDPRGRLIGRSHAGAETAFGYDASGQLGELRDPAAQTRRYVHDALGRLIGERDANGVQRAFRYDAHGLLAEEQVGGAVTQHAYDDRGRLVRTTAADGAETRFAYDERDRVREVESADHHVRLGYDDAGRVTEVEDVLAGQTLGYAYDARGLRSELRAPWGTTRYRYDEAGRLAELVDPAGGSTTYAYDLAGLLSHRGFPNGAQTHFTYDASGRLLEVRTLDAAGELIDRCRYAYDANGNRVEEETLAGVARFAYDAHDRLVEARYPGGRVEAFRYDAAGNRAARSVDGVTTEGVYRAQQLEGWGDEGFRYGERGGVVERTTPEGTWRYAYDGRGRLAEVVAPDGSATRYGYAPSGLRSWKEVDGQRTRFVYDFDDVVGEVGPEGELQASYVHGLSVDTPLSVEREGARHYLHADGRLNVTALTDAEGKLAGSYRYDAFGVTLEHQGAESPYRFGGRRLDESSQLYYHRARYYQPEHGRYLTPDPAGAWGGLNAYAYVDHNPLSRVDPEGAWIQILAGAGIGALVGGGLELATQLIENGGRLKEVKWKNVAAHAAGGALLGAATSVGAGAIAGVAKGGRMVKQAGRVSRWLKGFKSPIQRTFSTLGSKVRGAFKPARLVGAAKWPFKFAWSTLKALPKKIADGTIYGIVNAVLGVLVYNRITAGTFNVLKTLRETMGDDEAEDEAKPDSEQAKVIAIEARDKNLRYARDATHSRTGKVDWTVMAITGLQSRKEGLQTQRLILQQADPVDAEALAGIDRRIQEIDHQLDRYLDLMAWYYHSYDEIKGVTLRRMKEFGFSVERLERGNRRVPETEGAERDKALEGYAIGYEGREGRYRLDQQWPRTDAEAESLGLEEAAVGASGDPLDGLIDPSSRR